MHRNNKSTMKKAYYYLYETINLTNGKKYIGQHCTYDLNDGYYGSCKELINDIKKGDEYKVTILQFFNNIFDLGKAERNTILSLKADRNPNYYNKDHRLFFNYCFNGDRKVLDKISKSLKGKPISEKALESRRKAAQNRKPLSLEKRKIWIEKISNTLKGKKQDPLTIKKRSETLSKTNAIKYAEIRKKKAEDKEYRKLHPRIQTGENNGMYGKGYLLIGEKNGRYGKPTSKETREKISTALRNKPVIPGPKTICKYCGTVQRECIINRFHNEKCKHKPKI